MKRYLLKTLVVAGLTATTSLAEGRNHGAYLGLGVGPVIGHHTSGVLGENGTPQSFKFDINKLAPAFDVLVGYAFKVNSWHLGAEADYLFGNLNGSFNQFTNPGTTSAFAKVNSNGAWGAALRIGYHCDRMLGFIRLGVENRRFKVTANAFNPTPVIAARNEFNFNARKSAFTPGVGMQYNLTKSITGTLEYRIALYGKITKSLNSPIDALTSTFTIKPRVSTVLASFRYHF
jgi:opacity protein-like surface antigen